MLKVWPLIMCVVKNKNKTEFLDIQMILLDIGGGFSASDGFEGKFEEVKQRKHCVDARPFVAF